MIMERLRQSRYGPRDRWHAMPYPSRTDRQAIASAAIEIMNETGPPGH